MSLLYLHIIYLHLLVHNNNNTMQQQLIRVQDVQFNCLNLEKLSEDGDDR
jgi:hypothetical protein